MENGGTGKDFSFLEDLMGSVAETLEFCLFHNNQLLFNYLSDSHHGWRRGVVVSGVRQ